MHTQATEITLAKWAPYNQLAPILDNIDLDAAFRLSSINTGVPAVLMKPMQDVMEERQARQQKQEMAEMAQVGEIASKAIKNISGSVAPDSIAAQL